MAGKLESWKSMKSIKERNAYNKRNSKAENN
jgi:hypothetical protein